jgi:co-chaperonin GroES (HSP10)
MTRKKKEDYLVPLGDRVLVEREPLSEKSEGGIIVSTDQNDSPIRWGTVIEIGPDAFENGFEEGDRVAFNKYAGIVIHGERIILSEKELLCVKR